MSTASSEANLEPPQYLPRPTEERSGIALCLSGGGFRAALFHLGALRRLNELGILSRVKTISSVSGGSILAAHLAERIRAWPEPGQSLPGPVWEANVAAPFRHFTATDIRTGPILQRWLSPAHILRPQTTVLALARTYRQKLTSLRLGELPDRPRFIFCSTDLVFGVNWQFEREVVGDYQIGFARPAPPDWHVALAAAASSCFPPVFGPLSLDLRPYAFRGGRFPNGAQRNQFLGALALSDGGVYDNLGLEPVWKDHHLVLVSDGGVPFPFQNDARPFRRILRYIAVTSNQAEAVRKRWLIASFKKAILEGTYWGIRTAVTSYSPADPSRAPVLPEQFYDQELVEGCIATVRTDLDAFSEGEIKILENHGYILAEAAIQNHLSQLVSEDAQPFQIPHSDWMEWDRVSKALQASNRRFTLVKLIPQIIS
jgi:NTE family protein